MVEWRDAEAAGWVRESKERTAKLESIIGGKHFPTPYILIVPGCPITVDIEQDMRDVETRSDLPTDSILSARWCKKIERRSDGQKYAHATVNMRTPEDANYAIEHGVIVGGETIHPRRDKKLARQCHNCLQFNHNASKCQHPPRCKNCAQDHNTRDCSERCLKKCALCGSQDHDGWDKNCPTFVLRQAEFNAKYPENESVYFMTAGDCIPRGPARVPWSERFSYRDALRSTFPEQPPNMLRQQTLDGFTDRVATPTFTDADFPPPQSQNAFDTSRPATPTPSQFSEAASEPPSSQTGRGKRRTILTAGIRPPTTQGRRGRQPSAGTSTRVPTGLSRRSTSITTYMRPTAASNRKDNGPTGAQP